MAVSGLSTGSAPAGRRAGTRGNLPTGTTVATYPGSVTSPTMSRPDRPRPSPSARSRVTSVVLAALAMLAVVCPPALADDGDRMRRPRHSSDGIRGPIAPTVTDDRRPVVTDEVTRRIAPGVVYRRWDQTDARGRIRAYLLAVRYTVDGGGFGYAWPGRVPQRHKLRGMVADLGGVAGVNGDFFDIADTGAPLGIGHTDRFDQRADIGLELRVLPAARRHPDDRDPPADGGDPGSSRHRHHRGQSADGAAGRGRGLHPAMGPHAR